MSAGFSTDDWILCVVGNTADIDRLLEECYWPPMVLRDELKVFKQVEVFDAQKNAVTARFYVGSDNEEGCCSSGCNAC